MTPTSELSSMRADAALSSVEVKFSDCEKALLATVWVVEHFRRIASTMMALQGYDVEVKYAQNHKMALSQGLAECHHCDCEGQSSPQSLVITTPSLPSNHLYHDENACLDLPRVYVDGCSYHHESQIQAGAGIVWVNRSVEEPNNYWLGNKTSQYAEIAAVLIALQQATKLAMVQLVICSDSNYARHSFISHFPMWKDNGMLSALNKEVKNSELFLACDRLVTDQGMTVYWKKVKGHSQTSGPDKNGNDEADRLDAWSAASSSHPDR
uniref:ribonuclease H n=1 Tax=Scophthalmus maximus TaxID=52904 RepID=A0A8D3CKX2_SCOMX